MYPSLLLLPTLLTLTSSLSTTSPSTTSTRTCQDYLIPITTTSTEAIPNFQPITDNFDVASFISSLAARDSSTNWHPISGTRNASHTYNISGTICSPVVAREQAKTVLVATHGLGFDKRYWDIRMDAHQYSFVDYAISRGYSVFFYDRLGTGLSSKVSGYDGAQALTQLSILQQLSILLKSGQYTGSIGTPSKIAHVGHSFGSFLSQALITTRPDLSDAAILTGLAWEPSTQGTAIESLALRIASTVSEEKWPGLDNQYLTAVDVVGNAAFFFHGESYDKQLLWYSDYVSQPLAAIELLTGSSLVTAPASFEGPVMVIDGEYDFALCGGNCSGILDAPAKLFFPNATDLRTVLHPNTGHGFNFAYNATAAYAVMLDYLHGHQIHTGDEGVTTVWEKATRGLFVWTNFAQKIYSVI